MRRISLIAYPLLVLGYVVSTPATISANTPMMKGVISESGLACKSATMDVLIPLLRKADPKGHKMIEEGLKKGDCIHLSSGVPITIVGKDVHSKVAQGNYLIWHPNGKVFSISEDRVANIAVIGGVSPYSALQADRANPAPPLPEPNPIERPAQAGQEADASFSYPLAATIGAVLVAFATIGVLVARSLLGPRSEAASSATRWVKG